MARDLIGLIQKSRECITVPLSKTLDDGQPAAIKCEQMRLADYFALGKQVPMPSQRTVTDMGELGEMFEYFTQIIPHCVREMRGCKPVLGEDGKQATVEVEEEYEIEENDPNAVAPEPKPEDWIPPMVMVKRTRKVQKPAWEDEWVPFKVAPESDYPNNVITIADLDSLGDAVMSIGLAVVFNTQKGGEMDSLPPEADTEGFHAG